jgi:putative ABC transport system permease protein
MGHQIGPLGRRLVAEDEHEVIGVVADVKNTSLTGEPEPSLYSSVRQFPFRRMFIVLRGAGTPASIAAQAREELRRLDPTVSLGEVKSMRRVLSASVDPPRLVMMLMSAFALLSLTLAAIGIYGILSFSVSQRRREIGVRLALGARPRDVLRLVVGETLGLTAAGALIGVAVAIAGSRLLASLIYGVRPADPLTIVAVVGLVMVVAATACVVPGRRAALIDPARTLHEE